MIGDRTLIKGQSRVLQLDLVLPGFLLWTAKAGGGRKGGGGLVVVSG